MEEKHYPIISEEDSTCNCRAEEPVGAFAYTDEEVVAMDIDENEEWDAMPLIGPASYEEAIARIEASERDIEEGNGTPWEAVMQEAKDLIQRKLGNTHTVLSLSPNTIA